MAEPHHKLKPLYNAAFSELWNVARRHSGAVTEKLGKANDDGAAACMLLSAAVGLAIQSGRIEMFIELMMRHLAAVPGVGVERLEVGPDGELRDAKDDDDVAGHA